MNTFRITVSDCPHEPKHDYSDRAQCRAQRYKDSPPSGKRHVVPSSEVSHLWAHKAQRDARTSTGNFYFTVDTIYSYGSHFPIARHVANKSEQAVLFTTGRYSNTTSGHCSAVRSAISHLTVFNVVDVMADSKPAHLENLKDYAKRINILLLSASRARRSKDWKYNAAIELRAEAIQYAAFFKLGKVNRIVPDVPALGSDALAQIKAREAKRVADLSRELKRKNAENIARWRAGEYVSLPYGLPDMLRVVERAIHMGDSHCGPYETVVETSRGATFPISHAKRGLVLVRSVRERGESWHTNGKTCHLGPYQIDSISATGDVKAGCHTVAWSEIEHIAPQLDAINTPIPEPQETAEQPQA